MNQINNPIIQPWLDKAPKYSVLTEPPQLVFTQSKLGESSLKQTVSITNKGCADLQIDKILSHKDYIFSPVGDSSVLRHGETLLVDVIYRPTSGTVDPKASLQIKFGCGIPLSVLVPLSVTA